MDWKDALQNLKGDVAEEPNNPIPNTDDNTNPTIKQTGALRVLLDRKGRKGKDATIVEGFELPDDEISEIASKIKRHLGTGGSARGGEILIQGDKRKEVGAFLTAQGFKCKIISNN